jgi:endo-1,4-beta-xylanase
MRRFTELGLQVRITEMDVALSIPQGTPTTAQLSQQARIYDEIVGACLTNPRCTGITFWGLSDRYSWIPSVAPGLGAAHLFDERFQPKPAYDAVKNQLGRR